MEIPTWKAWKEVNMTTYMERLAKVSRKNESLLCVGLDPEPHRLPEHLRGLPAHEAILAFNKELIDATCDLVAAYKPNLAFYEALGPEGMETLRATVRHVPNGVPVIADAKRGDIDHTMRLYATAVFDVYGFDAVTASPYLGRDALLPFLDRADRGTYILCRTSNPGAADIAELDVGGEPLYLRVAERVPTWTSHANIGLVVGATAPTQLARVRAAAPVVPILLPGIGAQGGDLEASVAAGLDQTGDGLLVVVARQVMYASSGLRFAEDARTAAREIRDRINAARVTAIDALRGR
jgi:orotidine-5'-phosphate decarboxylase